ncbi:MAG TPA: hypoxanthine phosphoribosyltransferase, partial [Deltaproteobacteria bacterium]|nr:hypoxanthine phosphoribosyltransferase [Deltaproteobacteria bacterium]
CQICFLQASSYKDKKVSSGEVTLMHNLDLSRKEVLVVEDIVDTGLTLKYILEDLQQQNPESLEICALLSKNIPDKAPVPVKYVGFEIEDRFVVGYGLDFAEKYREVPHIACLD